MLREQVIQLKAEMSARYHAGESGRSLSRAYAERIDRLIEGEWQAVCAAYPGDSEPVLCVTGGFGRRDCVLGSDLDLLLLVPNADSQDSVVIRSFLRHLWDAGLEATSAIRTLHDLGPMFRDGDVRSQTALLEMRYLAGPESFWNEAQIHIQRATRARRWQRDFTRAKRDEQLARRERYGGTPFFLEPNVKLGEGGLRDWHTMLWIAQALGNAHEQTLADDELRDCAQSLDTLLHVRWGLHVLAQRAQDRLGFREQEQLGGEDVDAFMQAYFQAAAVLRDYSNGLIWEWSEPKRAWIDAFLRVSQRDAVTVKGRSYLRLTKDDDLGAAVTRLATASRAEKPCDPRSRAKLRRIAAQADASIAYHEAVPLLLEQPWAFWRFLRELHRARALELVFPAFTPLHYRMQRDAYHCYTIDIHLLRTVRACAHLLVQAEAALVQRARQALIHQAPILLAALYHDAGKGQDGPHEQVGAEMMKNIAPRLGLSEHDAALAVFLVRSHQVMPALAFRRDLHDPALIANFAETVATQERLAALYLLSIADLQSVGPQVFTEWKAALLDELYVRTANYLADGDTRTENTDHLRDDLVREVAARLDDVSYDAVRAWIDSMPDQYLTHMQVQQIAAHVQWWEQRHEKVCVFDITRGADGAWIIDVAAQDHPGVFSSCCAVFATHNINIIEARAYTGRLGNVVDRFRCALRSSANVGGAEDPILRDLRVVLEGKQRADQLYAQRQAKRWMQPGQMKRPVKVSIDNDVSQKHSVIDVRASDRIGLLYELSYCLSERCYNIASARIQTIGSQVRDAFYVRGPAGKILDAEEQAQLIARLTDIAEAG